MAERESAKAEQVFRDEQQQADRAFRLARLRSKEDEAATAADRRALILAEQQSERLHAKEQERRRDKWRRYEEAREEDAQVHAAQAEELREQAARQARAAAAARRAMAEEAEVDTRA